MEDLEHLISFLATSRNVPDPSSRVQPEVSRLFHEYHWPGNVAELERAVLYLAKTRPAGEIRPVDVQALLNVEESPPKHLVDKLWGIGTQGGFRLLQGERGCRMVAEFLVKHEGSSFGVVPVWTVLWPG